jgi:hypothetical protein
MNKKRMLIVVVGLGIVCGFVLRSAFSKSTKGDAPGTGDVAQNNAAPQAQAPAPAPAQSQAPTSAPVATPAPAPIAEYEDKTANSSDGKETLAPDGKETVGKETVGKEALPPVGESIGVRPEALSLLNPGAPTEYLGTPKNNPLLAPPNPVNVSGPVVSAETKPPVVVGPTE